MNPLMMLDPKDDGVTANALRERGLDIVDGKYTAAQKLEDGTYFIRVAPVKDNLLETITAAGLERIAYWYTWNWRYLHVKDAS